METPELKTYEIRIRVLGNEIFALGLSATDNSNRILAFGLLTVFCVLTIVGAYGDKLVGIFKSLVQ